MIHLSGRMERIVSMVTPGNPVCDVGCDHGFISIALVQRGIAPRALAMDVKEGPLRNAWEHIRDAGLSERIDTRLSDGLAGYRKGEAGTLIIAGMGGKLMTGILSEYPDRTRDFTELILSPQSEIPEFRAFLREQHFRILDEAMVYEDGKYYTVIRAIPEEYMMSTENSDIMLTDSGIMSTESEDAFGPVLLRRKDEILRQYLLEKEEKYDIILCKLESEASDASRSGADRIEKDLMLVREALRQYTETDR